MAAAGGRELDHGRLLGIFRELSERGGAPGAPEYIDRADFNGIYLLLDHIGLEPHSKGLLDRCLEACRTQERVPFEAFERAVRELTLRCAEQLPEVLEEEEEES
uniref:Uncharacterized protein n=1 Tax=Eutreptiella gymnastica TaxID=73025 RepID=A0A7S4GDD3_9EUGL